MKMALSSAGQCSFVWSNIFCQDSAGSSPQAEDMRRYGVPSVEGFAVTMDTIRKQRKALQRVRKNLSDYLQEVDNAISALENQESTLQRFKSHADETNQAVNAILSLWSVPEGKLLDEAENLVEIYHNNPAAMGLLYGTLGKLMGQDTLRESTMTLPLMERLTQIRQTALEAMQK